jgi:hypothetical protein
MAFHTILATLGVGDPLNNCVSRDNRTYLSPRIYGYRLCSLLMVRKGCLDEAVYGATTLNRSVRHAQRSESFTFHDE